MSVPKKKEIAAMPKEELKAKMSEIKMELMKEKAQVASGTVPKNPGHIKAMKKTVARILTVLKNEDLKKSKEV